MNAIANILTLIRSLQGRKRISTEVAPGKFRTHRVDGRQTRRLALSSSLERSHQQAKSRTDLGKQLALAPFYLCSEVWEPRATAVAVHRPYSHGAIGCRSWRMSGTGS